MLTQDGVRSDPKSNTYLPRMVGYKQGAEWLTCIVWEYYATRVCSGSISEDKYSEMAGYVITSYFGVAYGVWRREKWIQVE